MGLSFQQINALAMQAQQHGGYVRRTGGPKGKVLIVGETELSRDDAIDFLCRLNERYVELIDAKDVDSAAWYQGFSDALGVAEGKIADALAGMKVKPAEVDHG